MGPYYNWENLAARIALHSNSRGLLTVCENTRNLLKGLLDYFEEGHETKVIQEQIDRIQLEMDRAEGV